MSGIMLNIAGGSFAPSVPTVIGQAFGGGYYAGQIGVSSVATHYLVVAPKSTGEASLQAWGPSPSTTGATSVIAGNTNSATLAGLGSSYQAATFCEGLSIGGYIDWYLPAKNELEVCYYFLKPLSGNNATGSYASGSNANAVSPEPVSTNYTTTNPAITSASVFIGGGAQAFEAAIGSGKYYWSSTDNSAYQADAQDFGNLNTFTGEGYQSLRPKTSTNFVRAIRRVAV